MKAVQIGSLALREPNGNFLPSVNIYIGIPNDMAEDYAQKCAEAARDVLFDRKALASYLAPEQPEPVKKSGKKSRKKTTE